MLVGRSPVAVGDRIRLVFRGLGVKRVVRGILRGVGTDFGCAIIGPELAAHGVGEKLGLGNFWGVLVRGGGINLTD